MRNHEVTSLQPLLNEEGKIQEPGWARHPVWQYDRSRIVSPKFRIKERDYYLILNQDYACGFTLSDEGHVGFRSVSLLNFKEGVGTYGDNSDSFSYGKYENAGFF